jgi:hypothetical protein
VAHGYFACDISGVQGAGGFDQKNVNFLIGDGEMLHPMRHDDEFALADDGFAIAEFHAQRAFHDQKQFIFDFVMMPDELAFQLHGLDGAIIYFA